jgi:hypothetical protein
MQERVTPSGAGLPDSEPARAAISLLQRRGIEAEVLIPLVRRLEVELGRERAHAIARETIGALAREQGSAVAAALGRSDLEGFHEVRDSWGGAGGDLVIDTLREDGAQLDFNVTRCRFAEMYERLGARDLGSLLSCGRDFTLSEGYSSDLELTRTQTIMEGAAFCDFRYRYRPVETSEPGAAAGLPADRPTRDNAAAGTSAGQPAGGQAAAAIETN